MMQAKRRCVVFCYFGFIIFFSLLVLLAKGYGQGEAKEQQTKATSMSEYQEKLKAALELMERIKLLWGDPKKGLSKQLFKDPVNFCRRHLTLEEETIIRDSIALIKDEKLEWGKRGALLMLLGRYPHIKMLDGFLEIARQRPPEKEPWKTVTLSLMKSAVFHISCIADERAIEALIELIGSPVVEVRIVSMEQLEKLIEFPKGYRFGEFNPRKLSEEEWQKVLEVLRSWWKENKGKMKIYWQGAWEFLCS